MCTSTLKQIFISDDIYTNKKIYCFGQLYEVLGIDKDIENMKNSNEFYKYHVDNIICNQKTYDKIYDMLKYNLTKTKNKYSKIYKEQKLLSMLAFDALGFGPSTNEKVKNNYIKIILPGNKNYKNVKKEDIVI